MRRPELEAVPERASTLRVRVGYVDTDQGRMVHHSTYLRYLEAARVEHMRAHGIDYRSFELELHQGLAVVHADVQYKLPARFDDLLDLRTWIGLANRAKVRFDSVILRGPDLIARASITLCCVKLPEGRICSVPPEVIALGPHAG